MKSLFLVLSLMLTMSAFGSSVLNKEQDRLDDEIVNSSDISADLEILKLIK